MVLAEGVKMRASRSASVGIVTELVDMHATQGVRVIASDIVRDNGGRGFAILGESDSSSDVGVSADDSDYIELAITTLLKTKWRRRPSKMRRNSQRMKSALAINAEESKQVEIASVGITNSKGTHQP